MRHLLITIGLVLVAASPSACSAQGEDGGTSQAVYETKSSQGDISFELTPRVTEAGRLIVELMANTHSGDLADLDLAALVSLRVDGRTYRPVAATALEGHHSTGSVTFDARPPPSRFAVTIAPVRAMQELRFEWP